MSNININKKVFLDNPNIGELEKKYVLEALDSGFISTRGPLIKIFEQKFGDYLGGYVAATYSGTAALHLSVLYSLKKMELKNNKTKVGAIVPALTFAATANAVLYNNLIPIFVDVDINTWNIDMEKIPDIISKAKSKKIDVKIILPVHLYGNPVDRIRLDQIAKEYDLVVIEDAAEALGSHSKNLKCGTFGDFGTFSFNANKVITASSGGAVFSKNKEDIDYIRFLTLQARNESKGYYHEDLGFNYRMTNIEAAIILAQLEKLNYFLDIKRKFFKVYYHYLSNYVSFQEVIPDSLSNYWLISAIFNNQNIDELKIKLEQAGIPTRRIFYPLPLMNFYKKYVELYLDKEDLTKFYQNSFSIYNNGLCLPSSTRNTIDDIEFVANKILNFIR